MDNFTFLNPTKLIFGKDQLEQLKTEIPLYGTQEHLLALNTYGPCLIHRKSFAPIKDII